MKIKYRLIIVVIVFCMIIMGKKTIYAENQLEEEQNGFDLRLINYISAINEQEIKREVKVETEELKNRTKSTADYKISKVPVAVENGDYITFKFRIYNEGEKDIYVKEITEAIPDGLEFVYDNDITVTENGDLNFENSKDLTEKDKKAIEYNMSQLWTTKETDQGTNKITKISTEYLAKENEISEKQTMVKAYNKEEEISYIEVGLMLKVVVRRRF